MDLGCLPKLGPWLVTLVWITPCLETFSHCHSVFFGGEGNIFFLEAKAIYIERLLSYPQKGEQILEAIPSFLWYKKARFAIQRNQAISYLFIFPSVEYTPPLLLPCSYYSKIRYAFDLFQLYFYPTWKKRFHFNFVNESYEKQEVAKIVCQVWGYNPFLASVLRCSHERFENLVHGFFQKLKFKENVSRQHLFAYSCGLGLLFMSFHLVKWSKSRNVRPLSLDLITLLHSSWLTTSCLKLLHAIK